ncbi:hypothetical protein GCM10027294_22770 [Marinactinospora endophytica]
MSGLLAHTAGDLGRISEPVPERMRPAGSSSAVGPGGSGNASHRTVRCDVDRIGRLVVDRSASRIAGRLRAGADLLAMPTAGAAGPPAGIGAGVQARAAASPGTSPVEAEQAVFRCRFSAPS